MHICSLCFPPLFFPLLFSFFPLSNGDKCDLRETRHSVRGGGKKQRKKCVRTFRKDAFRNEKCEKQKQRAGNKTKPAVGRRAVTKKKKKKKEQRNRSELWVSRGGGGGVDASFIPDAIVRFSRSSYFVIIARV